MLLSTSETIVAYAVPLPTVTGNLQKEMLVIQSCLGAGEVAISDHRGSMTTPQELARIAR